MMVLPSYPHAIKKALVIKKMFLQNYLSLSEKNNRNMKLFEQLITVWGTREWGDARELMTTFASIPGLLPE